MDEARKRERLLKVLDGYFDTKTSTMVERVVGVATPDELDDPDEVDALFLAFVTLLEDRYDRADPGWRESAETFLRAEFDRQIEQARAFTASFDDL